HGILSMAACLSCLPAVHGSRSWCAVGLVLMIIGLLFWLSSMAAVVVWLAQRKSVPLLFGVCKTNLVCKSCLTFNSVMIPSFVLTFASVIAAIIVWEG